MKVLFAARGLPVAPYLVYLRHEWQRDATGAALDGDAENNPGGAYQFWFQANTFVVPAGGLTP